MSTTFLLYGANGYTGQLIAERARDFGLQPILAGRAETKLRPLAERLGYAYHVFSLNDEAALDAALSEAPAVLHAAGPFAHTARPMMEACLRRGVHYLDITGEIAVFLQAMALDEAARHAGVMLMPGVGFDVVPTDCLARYLKERMPEAVELKLAFTALGGGVSRGTALTMAENLGEGGAVRRDGRIVRVPLGHKSMMVPFPGKPRLAMTIPWGDVATAYHTTGIPNIEVYTGVHPKTYRWVRLQRYYNWLLRLPWIRAWVKRRIHDRAPGPAPEQRRKARSLVWGQARDAQGRTLEAWLSGPEGYTLTALTALIITRKVLSGEAPVGYQTPAGAYGADLILEVEGVERA